MTLEEDCYDSGTIQHELMHVLGKLYIMFILILFAHIISRF